jgi:hypothetical protein
MRKYLILVIVFMLCFGISCKDDNINDNIGKSNKSKIINLYVATLQNGKIILNFSQNEIKQIFEQKNPDYEFILVDILDDNPYSIENVPYLLYKIKDKASGEIISEISDEIVKQSEDTNITYYLSSSGSANTLISCSTTELEKCRYGCSPFKSQDKYFCSFCDPDSKAKCVTTQGKQLSANTMMYNAILSLINFY